MTVINTPCYVMGDIHAKITHLKNFMEQHRDSSLIVLGDCGFGFHPDFPQMLDHLARENGISLYCIRGNHDDPAFFRKPQSIGNLHLLPDYTELDINGKHALCVGGGISIDRLYRKEGVNWWSDEGMAFDWDIIRSISQPVDLLLSHTGPAPKILPSLSKAIPGLFRKDTELHDDIMREQNACVQLGEILKPKNWMFGHFHISYAWNDGQTGYRVLDVNEAFDLSPIVS